VLLGLHEPAPYLSEAQGIIQLSVGNWEDAKTTQENFSKQCIIVSQIRSMVERAQGDEEAANNTNEEFCKSTDGLLRKTPIVGHARGCLAYLLGDTKTGDATMVEATKTTVGAAMVVFVCHGGFLITSGCFIGAQRVKEVDAPELMRNPRQECRAAESMKRTATTNIALNKLDMLDKTMDNFISPFTDAFWYLPTTMFAPGTSSLDPECEHANDDSEHDMQVKLYITEAEEEEAFKKNQKTRGRENILQQYEHDERRRARSPSCEGHRRLQEWRRSVVSPKL
jgi:hypothetical protein